MNNIEVFNDTQNWINTNLKLKTLTKDAITNTYIISEGFTSSKTPFFNNSDITFRESLTLIEASRLIDQHKKTAVLNFANPVEPGGGVLRGANAQEEYLCRATNLYNCLISDNAAKFYNSHNGIMKRNQFNNMFLATDKIIYSPGITVIKEDVNYNAYTGSAAIQEYTNNWKTIDVITCAAPFFSKSEDVLPNGDLYYLFCRRIRNILEAAIDNEVEALVLGAFGCGAFHNPPTVVAQAFKSVLLEKRYKNAFFAVVFAVKRTGQFCENIEAFDIAFQNPYSVSEPEFSSERNKRRFFM